MVRKDVNVVAKKELLAEKIVEIEVYNPQVAKNAKAGQFVIIRVDSKGERIPLTITDVDRQKGIITLVSMRIGKTTTLLEKIQKGEKLIDLLGPLGKPSEIKKFGHVVCVGGGLGIAPIFHILKEIKTAGNITTTIIGARSKEFLIFEKKLKRYSDNFFVCTDDGSKGFKGFVSMKLKELIEASPDSSDEIFAAGTSADTVKPDRTATAGRPDRVIAIGPTLMMKSVCDVTKESKIKTIVSLNSIMIDGTGMCGTCRVEVGGRTKFACVDGPEFDGHLVNFNLLLARQNYFCEEERLSLEKYIDEKRTDESKTVL